MQSLIDYQYWGCANLDIKFPILITLYRYVHNNPIISVITIRHSIVLYNDRTNRLLPQNVVISIISFKLYHICLFSLTRQLHVNFIMYIFLDTRINVSEYRRGNQKWTIQKNWQHMIHKTKTKQNKNTTQYVLYTTIHKQSQIRK